MIRVRGKALIRKSGTSQEFEIYPTSLQFETVASVERAMGPERTHSGVIDHPQLGSLNWTLWEYPIGATNNRKTDVGPHELLEDFDFEVDATSPVDRGLQERDDVQDRDELHDDVLQARVDDLITWFFENFEDPANSLPYISREGGYQWIYGGPFEARDVLSENFPDETEEAIEAAVREIESDGITDWSPISRPDDFDRSWPEHAQDALDIPEEIESEIVDELRSFVSELPTPITAPTIAPGTDGLLHLTTPPDAVPLGADPVFDELGEATTALLVLLRGTNAYTALLSSVQSYADVLSSSSFSVSKFYSKGVRLENTAYATRRAIASGDLPAFPIDIDGVLSTVLDLHATFIMAHPEGRTLASGVTMYRSVPDNLKAARDAAADFSEAVKGTPKLFGEDVIAEVIEAADDVGQGPQPSRSTQAASFTFGNVVKFVLFGALFMGGEAVLQSAVLGSVPGMALATWGSTTINAAWSFLLEHSGLLKNLAATIGGDLSWMKRAAELLDRLKSNFRA